MEFTVPITKPWFVVPAKIALPVPSATALLLLYPYFTTIVHFQRGAALTAFTTPILSPPSARIHRFHYV